ncbi:glycosyltransferase family 2 protein, partial [Cellulomonas septica]
MTEEIGVVVVNYASGTHTLALLESLRGRDGIGPVVVVDNSPEPDPSTRAIEAVAGVDVTVVRPGRNIGFGAGNNVGLRALHDRGVDVAWLLNPDARVLAFTSGAVHDALRQAPDEVVLGTSVRASDRTREGVSGLSGWTGRVCPPERAWVTFVNGSSMVVRVRELLALGGFDESYFLYCEEPDLALRTSPPGARPVTVPELCVSHDGGGSTGSRRDVSRSTVTAYHANRSMVLLFARFRRTRLPAVVVARSVGGLVALCREPAVGRSWLRGLGSGLVAA